MADEYKSRMRIFEVKDHKKDHLELLLLADEQEDMIDRYLERGEMFALKTHEGISAVCVITDEGDGVLEIMNLAVHPDMQRRGYGRMMIDFVAGYGAGRYHTLLVGTGDSPMTIPFYERCGFVRSHVAKDFFLNNYDHPIIEDGVLLRDMVYLKRAIPHCPKATSFAGRKSP